MVLQSKHVVLASAISATVVGIVAFMSWRRSRRREYHLVGHVSGLFIYPVKSCKGIPLESTVCLSQGFRHDRRWVILNEKGNLISQRQCPSLALVTPSFDQSGNGDMECLYLDAPNMETLKVELPLTSKDIRDINIFGIVGEGQSAGEQAEAWLSKYLGKEGCKLYHMTKPRVLITEVNWSNIAKPEDKAGFGDYAPVLIVTTEALEDLNKVVQNPLDMKRFRPNVIVTGSKTYDEDNWKGIKIRDVEMRYLKHCDRCSLITVDPEKGIKTGMEPLETLRRIRMPADRDKRYGNSPFFGLHVTAVQEGEIKVGDAVYAKEQTP